MRPVDGMRVDVLEYCRVLASQLRLAGLPEARVRVVVQDVLAHVEATHEDPVEAFGQPTDYAAQWARPPGVRRVLALVLASAVGFPGFWLAVAAFTSPVAWAGAVPVTPFLVSMVIGTAVAGAVQPWTVGLWLERRAGRRVGKRRSLLDPAVDVLTWAVLIVVVLVVVQRVLGPDGDGPVLFPVPRWLMLAVGLGGMVLSFTLPSPGAQSMPRSPADRRSWWARARSVLDGSGNRRRS
ncbi:hypothetical protein [Arthrobacter sp. NEB 688]|uniref:hypothetical protein n=1 Tax=Arthrobacter sp. NEB 688 TaxID=904039 RepID=UPI001562FF71|nr:hypothetical protein [Arthrobacter sp. NEB 688]QKE85679.1 hypothetical protein HL663_18290 [Arthrobacter sp. NEB 688]